MVKDLKEHPRVCGQGVKQVRGSRTVPRFEDEDGDLHTLRGTGTWRRAGNYAGPWRGSLWCWESRFMVGDKPLKDISVGNVPAVQRNQKRGEVEQSSNWLLIWHLAADPSTMICNCCL